MSEGTDSVMQQWSRLLEHPTEATRFDWYVLLRLAQAAMSDRPEIGYGTHLSDDGLRLGQPPFFHPPTTTVGRMRLNGPVEDDDRVSVVEPASERGVEAWIESYHFGLFGPYGPLPLHLTEYAHRKIRMGDGGVAAFCNVLHHRFLSFFFRAWAMSRKEIGMDRVRVEHGTARLRADDHPHSFDFYIGSLLGCGLTSLHDRDTVPDMAKLYYSGLLIKSSRNAESLAGILEDHFGVPVAIEEFVRRTVSVPETSRWVLGCNPASGSLGRSILLGATMEDLQIGFRIVLGPLGREDYNRFLPGTARFRELAGWIRLYTGSETGANGAESLPAVWDLQLILRGSEAPASILGRSRRAELPPQLGWTFWMFAKPPAENLMDLIICPAEADTNPGKSNRI